MPTLNAQPQKRNPKKRQTWSQTWREWKKQAFRKGLLWLGAPIIQSAARTWRLISYDIAPETQALIASGSPVIFALWHGRMFTMLLLPVIRKSLCVMISASNDGQAIAEAAYRLGFGEVASRASHKNSAGAMMHLLDCLKQNFSVVMTVDGPRGPAYQVKPGVVWLSEHSGIPIIPVSGACLAPIWRFPRAWDQFQAPNFFSPVRLAIGAPVWPTSPAQPLSEGDLKPDESKPDALNVLAHSLTELTQQVDSPQTPR